MCEIDQPLEGGVIGAVRVGDTVRKPAGPWTPTVQALLRHLRATGFEYAPEPLGVDDAGREMVAFIEGVPGMRPWPPPILREQGVVILAELTRRFHIAVASFRPTDPVWRIGPRALQPGEIVCHGDLGPWNTVWHGGELVGLIDWDTAEPDSPLLDVASLALNVVPLRDDVYAAHAGFDGAAPRSKRLQVLCRTYGHGTNPEDVLRQVGILHRRELERTLRWGAEGREPWATFLGRGDELQIREDMHWLADHRGELLMPT